MSAGLVSQKNWIPTKRNIWHKRYLSLKIRSIGGQGGELRSSLRHRVGCAVQVERGRRNATDVCSGFANACCAAPSRRIAVRGAPPGA